ncbi:hypothetical protein C0J52_26171 [Blattella germanica]|nr:hypothetical protein C0J52_26171 [Blattella germanica]
MERVSCHGEDLAWNPAISHDSVGSTLHAPAPAKSSKTKEERHKYLCESLSRDLSTNGIRCKQQTTSNPFPYANHSLQYQKKHNSSFKSKITTMSEPAKKFWKVCLSEKGIPAILKAGDVAEGSIHHVHSSHHDLIVYSNLDRNKIKNYERVRQLTDAHGLCCSKWWPHDCEVALNSIKKGERFLRDWQSNKKMRYRGDPIRNQ